MAKITDFRRKAINGKPPLDDFDQTAEISDNNKETEVCAESKRKEHGVRNIIIALFLLFCGVMLYIFKDDINLYQFKNAFHFMQATAQSAALSSTNIVYEGAASNQFGIYDDNIVVLTKSKLTVYDKNGTEKLVAPVSIMSPALRCDGKKIVYYDQGKEQLFTAGDKSVLKNQKFSHGIINTKMNEKGYLAVITSDSSFKCILTVYDSSFEEVFQWAEADNYIVDASVNKEGTKVLAVYLGSYPNNYQSSIKIFSVTNGNSSELDVSDCGVIVFSQFRRDNSIIVVGDKKIKFFESDGRVLGDYDVGSKLVNLVATHENNTVVHLTGVGDSTTGQLVWLDHKGAVSAEVTLNDEVKSLSCYNGYAAVLTNKELFIYDTAGVKKQSISVSMDMETAVLSGINECVLFGMNRVYIYK